MKAIENRSAGRNLHTSAEAMERTDYVPFNDASGSASVNILAATVRTHLPPEFARTHRGRRGWEGHRSHLMNSFARSFQKRQWPSGPEHGLLRSRLPPPSLDSHVLAAWRGKRRYQCPWIAAALARLRPRPAAVPPDILPIHPYTARR
jgi:hypothetical protein